MPLTLAHRGRLVGFALFLYGIALGAMLLLEDVPSLGIAYFLYLPIALVALATSPLSGAAAGVIAAEVYAIGEVLGSPVAEPDIVSTTSGVRLLTYTAIGAIVGRFAHEHRSFTFRLKALAERDPLTGVLNARAHEAVLARLLGAGEQFALVLVDVDDLKEVNDLRGHAAGNEHLQRLAAALAGAARRNDTVARIGGDEFAVLVADADPAATSTLCTRIERLLAEAGAPSSLGWAVFPEDATDARTLFQRADERLYARKADRRGDRRETAPLPAGPAWLSAEALG